MFSFSLREDVDAYLDTLNHYLQDAMYILNQQHTNTAFLADLKKNTLNTFMIAKDKGIDLPGITNRIKGGEQAVSKAELKMSALTNIIRNMDSVAIPHNITAEDYDLLLTYPKSNNLFEGISTTLITLVEEIQRKISNSSQPTNTSCLGYTNVFQTTKNN